MSSNSSSLSRLIQSSRDLAAFQSIDELLNWDQRTLMPSKAADYRAEQITLLSGLIHEKMTSAERGDWIQELEQDSAIEPGSDESVIVSRLAKQYRKESKVPKRLVEELARCRVMSHESWVEARAKNDYSLFAGHLKEIVKLLKEKTDAIGYANSAYDVLLDDYEPDAKSAEIESVFTALRTELVPLISKIAESKKRPDKKLVNAKFAIDQQRQLGIDAARKIGFDFEAGRIDETHHPFCCTVGPKDIRITTRYDEGFFNTSFFGTLHEAGHGLYEQGLRADQFGLPTGEYCSLGIHESQSRLWENMVGRSLAFWKCFFPLAQKCFPEVLSGVAVDEFFGAVNDVEPSLVRVEADEATYSLHIIIRFELEQELFGGSLDVNDLPQAWNDKYEQYLGIRPDSDSNGVLQDVHWSEALFGYFPTYSLGNLYAAQLFAAADKELSGLPGQFEKGNFSGLLNWLRTNVHQHGKSYSAGELVERATGQTMSHEPFLNYLNSKYEQIFDL